MGSYRFRRFFLSLLVVFVLFSVCSKSYATTTPVVDIEQEVINEEKQWQNDFIILCLYPFLENTQAWNNTLKPILDDIHQNNYDFYIWRGNSSLANGQVAYNIRTYYAQVYTNTSTVAYTSKFNGITYSLPGRTLNGTSRVVIYDVNNNSFSDSSTQNAFTIADVIRTYKTDLWYDFMNLVYGSNGGTDYTSLLNSILNYLDDIENYISHIDIVTSVDRYGYILSQIYNVCDTISQNIGNYSQDLQNIQDKLDDINDELTDIYNYLNDTSINTNTITDNFPTNSGITSPTDSILANIFTQYQNAFTSTNYTDIVIPLGFVNDNLTIPSNYTETFFPTALVTIIQLCYWYVISRWIILSLIKLVNSLRNLDFMEKTNDADPKTELL